MRGERSKCLQNNFPVPFFLSTTVHGLKNHFFRAIVENPQSAAKRLAPRRFSAEHEECYTRRTTVAIYQSCPNDYCVRHTKTDAPPRHGTGFMFSLIHFVLPRRKFKLQRKRCEYTSKRENGREKKKKEIIITNRNFPCGPPISDGRPFVYA